VLPSNPEKKLSVIQMILNPNNNTWQKNIALIIVVGLYNHSGVDRPWIFSKKTILIPDMVIRLKHPHSVYSRMILHIMYRIIE
jgi:hypothetical protein